MDEDPKAQGRAAQRACRPLSSCPYLRSMTERWLEWRRGWLQAAAEEQGSQVHYHDNPLRGPSDATAGEQPVHDCNAPMADPGHNNGETGHDNFKPPTDTWRDDRNDPPGGQDWEREWWKDDPKGGPKGFQP